MLGALLTLMIVFSNLKTTKSNLKKRKTLTLTYDEKLGSLMHLAEETSHKNFMNKAISVYKRLLDALSEGRQIWLVDEESGSYIELDIV